MFKMSAFSVDTGQQTTPPLVDGVVHNRLVQFAPHGDQTLAQPVDVLVIYKSMHALVTFCVSRRRRKMYCGHARLCVCVCVCPRPYAHTTARTRM